MAILVVDEMGAAIHLTGERLLVRKEGEEVRSVRMRDLERLVLVGPVDLSTPAICALLDAGIETDFLSRDGRYRGRLAPAEGKNVLLRQQQFRRADDTAFCLGIARAILAAKLGSCRYVILRHHRNHPNEGLLGAADYLSACAARLASQKSIEACMGVEGAAARAYFSALGTMVRREFAFEGRTRRPPRDPVNALLSYGYALLTGEIGGALAAHGLDMHVGFLHSVQYGRPALALDILEEFRPLVADRLALKLVNNGVLSAEHFEPSEEGGMRLTEPGRARYLAQYHQTMSREVDDRRTGGKTSFRSAIRVQAGRMRAAVQGEANYVPYTLR